MAANLPPQFFELQRKFNQTSDVEEKIKILKEMLAICPKHKGTERVQEEIKKKIAKLKKKAPKKVKSEPIYFVEKEGAGQVLVLGTPNSGKTSLINALSETNFKVADYPFTTQLPNPAMMRFENVSIQLVDLPPIKKDFKPGWIKNLAKQADKVLVLIDLNENPSEQIREIFEILKEWRVEKEKTFLVGNKIDVSKSQENLKDLKVSFEIFEVSAKEKTGIERLKKKIFQELKIIRIYPKDPKKEIDFEKPFILKEGVKLIDFVKKINEEWVKNFKGAKLYETNLKGFKIVGRDYNLKDGDIIEIKI